MRRMPSTWKGILGSCVLVVAIVLGLREWVWWGCHRGVYNPHQYLATKTPYLHPHKIQHHPSHDVCEPTQIWLVVRHGTRNPSAKVIRRMRTLLPPLRDQIVDAHENGKGSLCEAELEAIRSWTPSGEVTEEREKVLVRQGREELRGIGRRMKDRFPTLLNKKYDNSTYKFKFTKTERAGASCSHFVEEVVGREAAETVWYPEPLAADPVLRFYKGCPRWKKEIDKNPETYEERRKFEQSPLFNSVRGNVQFRAGLRDLVSIEVLEVVYMTCAFETAWNPTSVSPWCHLFDEDDLEKLQYRQDLEYYYVDGYGYDLTYKQACPAIMDMIQHFRSKIEKESESPSLIAYFTHSGTILKLISRFGLFNDTVRLLHDNFHLHTGRLWRTSQIDKFATNIAAVLYRCSKKDYRVGLLFQEQPVPIPGCGDDLCPLDKFLQLYQSVIDHCDLPQMCQL